MPTAEDWDGLICAVHEAAFDPEGWPGVAAGIARAAGVSTVLFGDVPVARMTEAEIVTHNIDPQWIEQMVQKGVMDCSVYTAAAMTRPVGSCLDLRAFGDRHYQADPAARAFLQPRGLREGLFMAADRGREAWVPLAIFNEGRRGPLGPNGAGAPARIAPHLRRAYRTRRRLSEATGGRGLLETALETMGVGVLGLGAELRIVLANPEAERVLAQADGLRQVRGRLVIGAPAAEAALVAAIGAALTDRHEGDGPLVAVQRGSGAPDVMLHVCPRVAARTARLPPGVAAVLVTDPLRPARVPDAAAIAERFRLTPAEAEVARLAATGRGMPFVAEALGVSVNTARTHLKAVYAKTGVRRQAELARRIATVFPQVRAATS